MAKKNFDAFINAAGKKPKPTPEEVEAMAKQLHQTAAVRPTVGAAPTVAKVAEPAVETPIAKPKKSATSKKVAAPPLSSLRRGRSAEPGEAPKEKVRITIDLAKDLYKRMKLAVVENETEISAYVRSLIESDLSRR